jgi:predicted RecA/RadA family phage recombinase
MAKFFQTARHVDIEPAAETAAGILVQIGNTVGIVDPKPDGTAWAAGERGSVSIRCAVEIDNPDGLTFSYGDPVGYVAATDKVIATTTGDFDAGVCINPGGAGAADKVQVLLYVD